VDFRDYVRALRRGWLAILILTIVGVGSAFAYLAVAPRTFVAESVVLVTTQGAANVAELQQGSQFGQQTVATYARVVDSQAVLDPVISRLNLPLSSQQLADRVTVTVVTGTTLLSITTQDSNASSAAQISNAVAASSIDVITALNASAVGVAPLVKVEQIQNATAPSSPVSPNRQVTVALGLFVGLVLGVIAALLAFVLDRNVRTPGDLRLLTDRPVLATVPLRKSGQAKPLAMRDDPSSRVAEAFRTLRTNLRYLETSSGRSFVVTSPTNDEDKSNVAANLAWALAESHYSVVLVDTNLRHPQVDSVFKLAAGPGLSDVLTSRTGLLESLVPTGHGGLSVLLAGTAVSNPSELLGSAAMLETLRALEQRFDYVILDSSPVLSFTDSALVSASASGTVIAVAFDRTRREQLAAALVTLSNVGVEPLGIVVTRAKGSIAAPPPRPIVPSMIGSHAAPGAQ
jgi:capsular exopolysaccharide synthesis family protein